MAIRRKLNDLQDIVVGVGNDIMQNNTTNIFINKSIVHLVAGVAPACISVGMWLYLIALCNYSLYVGYNKSANTMTITNILFFAFTYLIIGIPFICIAFLWLKLALKKIEVKDGGEQIVFVNYILGTRIVKKESARLIIKYSDSIGNNFSYLLYVPKYGPMLLYTKSFDRPEELLKILLKK